MDDWYPVTQYGADRRAAEVNDDLLHEASMKRTYPKSKPAPKTGVPVCMTCGHKYDVEFVDGKPKFYDHGTATVHRCKSGGA